MPNSGPLKPPAIELPITLQLFGISGHFHSEVGMSKNSKRQCPLFCAKQGWIYAAKVNLGG
jgi:hypothetical protein